MNVLLELARNASVNAYAPYSRYPVGACLRDAQGRTWAACNVENASYGLSVCAERNAIAAMVAGGGTEIRELLVCTRDGAPPCGACLQVMREFTPDPASVRIYLANGKEVVKQCSLAELLPHGFALRTREP